MIPCKYVPSPKKSPFSMKNGFLSLKVNHPSLPFISFSFSFTSSSSHKSSLIFDRDPSPPSEPSYKSTLTSSNNILRKTPSSSPRGLKSIFRQKSPTRKTPGRVSYSQQEFRFLRRGVSSAIIDVEEGDSPKSKEKPPNRYEKLDSQLNMVPQENISKEITKINLFKAHFDKEGGNTKISFHESSGGSKKEKMEAAIEAWSGGKEKTMPKSARPYRSPVLQKKNK